MSQKPDPIDDAELHRPRLECLTFGTVAGEHEIRARDRGRRPQQSLVVLLRIKTRRRENDRAPAPAGELLSKPGGRGGRKPGDFDRVVNDFDLRAGQRKPVLEQPGNVVRDGDEAADSRGQGAEL
jgi:hypothetical protein